MRNEALQKAIDEVGGQKALADRVGTTQSQIWYWLEKAKKGVPGEYVLPIVDACGGVISPNDLRPDIYPLERAGAA